MKVAVLGTGGVGQTIGSKLVERGHEVRWARAGPATRAVEWAGPPGRAAREGGFAEPRPPARSPSTHRRRRVAGRARGGGAGQLAGKVLVDVANPLDFSQGCPRHSASATTTASASGSRPPSPTEGRQGAQHRQLPRSWSTPARFLGAPGTILDRPATTPAPRDEVAALLHGLRLAGGLGPRPRRDRSPPGGWRCTCRCGCGCMDALDTAAFNIRVVR